MLQRDPRAHRHALHRAVRHVAGNPDLLRDQPVQVSQHSRPAGQHDSAVDDVRGQLWRRSFEDRSRRANDRLQRVRHRLRHVRRRHCNRARQPGDLIPAAHLVRDLFLQRQCTADRNLQLLGRPVADNEIVAPLHIGGDRVVQPVTGNADALADDDAVHRDHGRLGASAADIDDHMALRNVHGDARADRRRQRLRDQVRRPPRPSSLGRVLHGPLLDARDAGWHADHHFGLDH